jgi:hypothetical protein
LQRREGQVGGSIDVRRLKLVVGKRKAEREPGGDGWIRSSPTSAPPVDDSMGEHHRFTPLERERPNVLVLLFRVESVAEHVVAWFVSVAG